MKNILIFALAALIVGCGNNPGDDGISGKDKETGSRLEQIAKASGGDWDKLSQADKDFLVKDVAQGSEQTAKMLLQSKAGRLSGGPGGKTGH